MNATRSLTYLCLCLLVFAYAKEEEGASKVCLGCICDAVSNCNVTSGCAGEVCGPFHITRGYWSDAGKPTLDGDSASDDKAFANCVNEPFCAARAVQGYMKKYSQDCNGDGAIDCDDYARIHQLGGYGCTGVLDPTYESTYSTCFKAFQ